MKKILLTAAFLLITSNVFAATVEIYDSAGNLTFSEDGVESPFNSDVVSFGLSFGVYHYVHSAVHLGPGAYSIDTIQGPSLNFTVPAGMVGGHMLLDWGVSTDMDFVNVWDAAGNSIDIDGDGIPGLGMVDGPYSGFSLNFSGAEFATVPEPTSMLLLGSGLAGLVGLSRKK